MFVQFYFRLNVAGELNTVLHCQWSEFIRNNNHRDETIEDFQIKLFLH